MSKTSIAKLKDNFRIFENLLPAHNKRELGRRIDKKVKPDERYWGKEEDRKFLNNIENDFIRLYIFEDGSSIGFASNNIQESELDEIITLSAYKTEIEKYHRDMDYETVKDVLKNFILHLKDNSFTIDNFIKLCKLKTLNKQKKVHICINEFITDNKSFLEEREKVKAEINNIEPSFKKDMEEIDKKIEEYTQKLLKKHNITERENKVRSLKNKYNGMTRDLTLESYTHNRKKGLIYNAYNNNKIISNNLGLNQFADLVKENFIDKEV